MKAQVRSEQVEPLFSDVPCPFFFPFRFGVCLILKRAAGGWFSRFCVFVVFF